MSVVLHTTHGSLPVELYYKQCPKAAFNFLALCASGYYDGCVFYRHIPGVLLQTGDPTNSGKGGKSIYTHLSSQSQVDEDDNDLNHSVADGVRDERAAPLLPKMEASPYFDDEGFGTVEHNVRGTLSMAHRGNKPNTNASQFFVLCRPQLSFDGVFTAFGRVRLDCLYDAETEEKGKAKRSAAVPEMVSSSETDVCSSSKGDSAEAVSSLHGRSEADRRRGEEVLQSIEDATLPVDAKNIVINTNKVRIMSATVLYNPFAAGDIRL